MEPAIKTAINSDSVEKIYVMATDATLRLKKFSDLINTLGNSNEIVPITCSGLVEIIESGIIEGEILEGYLDKLFSVYSFEENSAIVLGCTHYIFIKDFLKDYFEKKNTDGNQIRIEIIDGNLGTIKQLARKLEEESNEKEFSSKSENKTNKGINTILKNENVEILSSDTTEKTKDVYIKLFGGVEYEIGRQRF